MASVLRWITARDDPPPRSRPSNPSSGDRHSAIAVIPPRGNDDTSRTLFKTSQVSRDGVTYASRDDKRNVEFVCHLPEGSRHARQAQEIAGGIYSGRSGEGKGLVRTIGKDSGRRMLENGEGAGVERLERLDLNDRHGSEMVSGKPRESVSK